MDMYANKRKTIRILSAAPSQVRDKHKEPSSIIMFLSLMAEHTGVLLYRSTVISVYFICRPT